MQFIKVVLVAVVFIVNLAIAQPSWAGKNFTKGTDYAEVTQELNELLRVQTAPEQAGYTPEEFQSRLAKLQLQKILSKQPRNEHNAAMKLEERWLFMPINPKNYQLNSTI